MEMPKEFYDMVCSDIKRIEESGSLSSAEQFKLHRELDGKYQSCIKDWYKSLWGFNPTIGSIHYSSIDNDQSCMQENLEMMKAKLETYKYGMNAILLPELPATRACSHKPNTRISEEILAECKAKICRRTVVRQKFLTRQSAKFAGKTCVWAYVNRP